MLKARTSKVGAHVAAAAGLLGLVACADTGIGGGGKRFPAEGALYGAGLGAAAGCATVALGDDRELSDCLKRAAVGGALGAAAGAAAGHVVRDRSHRHAADEARLEERLRAAEEELETARQASDAARRMVREHRIELSRLEAEVARGEADQGELSRAVMAAREDARRIARARDGLSREVARLDADLGNLREQDTGVPSALIDKRDGLHRELARLDEQLAALIGAADAASTRG